MALATLRSLAYRSRDILDCMVCDSGIRIEQLRVDGGACVSDLLMQFQADILGVPVARPHMVESTAIGAAYLAGLGVGLWNDLEDLETHHEIERVFEPQMSESERERLMRWWRKAVERTLDWAEED